MVFWYPWNCFRLFFVIETSSLPLFCEKLEQHSVKADVSAGVTWPCSCFRLWRHEDGYCHCLWRASFVKTVFSDAHVYDVSSCFCDVSFLTRLRWVRHVLFKVYMTMFIATKYSHLCAIGLERTFMIAFIQIFLVLYIYLVFFKPTC